MSSIWNDADFAEAVMLCMDTDSDSDDEAAIHAAARCDCPSSTSQLLGEAALVAEKFRTWSVIVCSMLDCCITTSSRVTLLSTTKLTSRVFSSCQFFVHKVTIYDPCFEQKRTQPASGV